MVAAHGNGYGNPDEAAFRARLHKIVRMILRGAASKR